MVKVNWSGLLNPAQRCKRQAHHTLKTGTKVELAGLSGHIVGYCRDRVNASQPDHEEEWYYIRIYDDKSNIPWKCSRQYLCVHETAQ